MEPSPQLPPKLVAFELKTLSWTLVLSGAISILIGVLAFVAPLPTVAAVVLLFGVYALVDGLLALGGAARSVRRHRRAWPQAVRGVAGVFVGVFALAFPPVTGVMLLVIAAIWAVVIGVLELLTAVRLRRNTGRAWLYAVYGVVSIAFGAFLVLSPVGLFAATALIGFYALARGMVATWVGFSMHRAAVRL